MVGGVVRVRRVDREIVIVVRWSTGVLSLLVGMPVRLVGYGEAVWLRVVPEAGAWLFVEPEGRWYPQVRAGLEVGGGSAVVNAFAGMNAVFALGPAGALAGMRWQIGARILY